MQTILLMDVSPLDQQMLVKAGIRRNTERQGGRKQAAVKLSAY